MASRAGRRPVRTVCDSVQPVMRNSTRKKSNVSTKTRKVISVEKPCESTQNEISKLTLTSKRNMCRRKELPVVLQSKSPKASHDIELKRNDSKTLRKQMLIKKEQNLDAGENVIAGIKTASHARSTCSSSSRSSTKETENQVLASLPAYGLRRSSRKRTFKTALELLGKCSKSEAEFSSKVKTEPDKDIVLDIAHSDIPVTSNAVEICFEYPVDKETRAISPNNDKETRANSPNNDITIVDRSMVSSNEIVKDSTIDYDESKKILDIVPIINQHEMLQDKIPIENHGSVENFQDNNFEGNTKQNITVETHECAMSVSYKMDNFTPEALHNSAVCENKIREPRKKKDKKALMALNAEFSKQTGITQAFFDLPKLSCSDSQGPSSQEEIDVNQPKTKVVITYSDEPQGQNRVVKIVDVSPGKTSVTQPKVASFISSSVSTDVINLTNTSSPSHRKYSDFSSCLNQSYKNENDDEKMSNTSRTDNPSEINADKHFEQEMIPADGGSVTQIDAPIHLALTMPEGTDMESQMACEVLAKLAAGEGIVVTPSTGEEKHLYQVMVVEDGVEHPHLIEGVQTVTLQQPVVITPTTDFGEQTEQCTKDLHISEVDSSHRVMEVGLPARPDGEKLEALPRLEHMKQLIVSAEYEDMVKKLQPSDSLENHATVTPIGRGKKVITCLHCKKQMTDRHAFRRHMQAHTDIEFKPWKCPLCPYKATVRAQIGRHINIHSNIKGYVCKECGKGFNFKQKLVLHMKYHLDIRDKKCHLCSMAFHEYKTLKNHMHKVHGTDEISVAPRRKHIMKEMKEIEEKMKSIKYNEDEESNSLLREINPSTLQMEKEEDVKKDNETTDVTSLGESSLNVNKGIEDTEAHKISDDEVLPDETMDQLVHKFVVPQKPAGAHVSVTPRKRRSHLYGTKKTIDYTKKYKEGKLPIADRNCPRTKRNLKKNSAQAMPKTGIDLVDKTLILALEQAAQVNSYSSRTKRDKAYDVVEPNISLYCEKISTEGFGGSRGMLYQCKLCPGDTLLPSRTQFMFHLEQNHRKIQPWCCHLCNYTTRMRTSLLVHLKIHSGVKDHCCNICGKSFAFKQKLKNHMRYHLNKREFKCSQCNKGFNEKNDLSKHIKRVHTNERPHVCSQCEKSFKDSSQLKRHMTSHITDGRFLCSHCNRYYRSKTSLAQHMKSHTCMFHCEICDKDFGSYSGFMAHKVMHDESYEGYKCDQCPKVLHTKGSLTRHLLVCHSNERPFACEKCSKCFKTKKDLKNHAIVHSTQRDFECNICHFQCKRSESLRVHMRRHAEVKPFACGLCNKEYTQKHSLAVHRRTHITATEEVRCTMCDSTFITQQQLQQHMQAQHGQAMPVQSLLQLSDAQSLLSSPSDTPLTVYMCEECNAVFMTQDNLAVHILAEHMKQGWGTMNKDSGKNTDKERSHESEDPGNINLGKVIEVMPQNDTQITTNIHNLENHSVFDGQRTVETIVAISDPGSSQSKLVSLIHPIESQQEDEGSRDSKELEPSDNLHPDIESDTDMTFTQVVTEQIEDTATTDKFSALYDADQSSESFVTISDPQKQHEMLVAVNQSGLETLLAVSETQPDEELGLNDQYAESFVAVAETVEIPVTGPTETVLSD